jgi:hypothetical protein
MHDRKSKYGLVLRVCWTTLFGTTVFLLFYPVAVGIVRLFLVAAVPLLLLGTSGMLWRQKRLRLLPVGALAALILLLVAPGRTPDRERLRGRYLECLRQYEGVRYLWGGESGFGIDCSGLVRRGLMRASLLEGLRTVNPELCRGAFDMWWHDCSARSLRDEYRGWTRRLLSAPGINRIEADRIVGGDIAVTSDGVHVLVYLGGGEWMEADPGLGKVIRVQAPATGNPWFETAVQILRWRRLEPPDKR